MVCTLSTTSDANIAGETVNVIDKEFNYELIDNNYFYYLIMMQLPHSRFTAFFPGHPGEPVPEENFWTLWCMGRLTEADTLTIRLGATPSGLRSAHLQYPPWPDALPAAQPTVSKH